MTARRRITGCSSERIFCGAGSSCKLGMADSAIEVARHLLEFGLTSDEWADDFVRLLMNLGLADEAFQIQAKSGKPELKDQLLLLAADQAVIHPGRIQDTSPEIAREASLIRESLEKITAGEFESALTSLRDLPRSSLLSDWKFFARGLAAHYRGENEECRGELGPTRRQSQGAPDCRSVASTRRRWMSASVTDAGLASPRERGLRRAGARAACRDASTDRGPGLAKGDPRAGFAAAYAFVASIRGSPSGSREYSWRHSSRRRRKWMPTKADDCSTASPGLRNRWRSTRTGTASGPSSPMRSKTTARARVASGSSTPAELETIPAFSPAERPLVEAMIWNRVAMLLSRRGGIA